MQSKWLNYVGQLRLYSLLDLVLLLLASNATPRWILGSTAAHVGFLAFLESVHKQEGREPVAKDVGLALLVTGVLFLGQVWPAQWYLFFSILYAAKNQRYWGLFSPFARGAQIFCLTAPFASWKFCLLASSVMVIRNILGDFRDVIADRRDGLHTWPVVLGIKDNWLFLHLAAVLTTTWVWWNFTEVSPIWPAALNMIAISTYYITPRSSNENAFTKMQSYVRRLHLV